MMEKKSKAVVRILLLIAVLAAAAWFLFHRYSDKLRSELAQEQERKALLEERVNEILSQLDSEKAEKESLLQKIDDALTEQEILFDSAAIMEEVCDIEELATLEYRYTNVGTVDAAKQFTNTDINIPFSKKTAVVTMDGIIKVGIDVEQIGIETVEEEKKIIVRVPEAKLLSNELDENSVQIYDEKNGLFNKLTLEDGSAIRQEIKDKAVENAVKNGVYEQAIRNVENVLRCMIEAAPGGKDYQIVFER